MRRALVVRIVVVMLAGVVQFLSGCRGEEDVDRPRIAEGVAMKDVRFRSAALGREMPYRVFLPEKIAPGMKLPVVYLLHGGGGEFRDWSNYSDVSQYARQGIILVMPEGNFSYYVNAVDRPEDRYEDYLAHDLIADVESRFPAERGGAHRAIAGVSMGGFGAVYLALRHPNEFVFAGAISAAIEVTQRRFNLINAGQWRRFRGIFGPMDSTERAERNPFQIVQKVDPRSMPYLYLTAGSREPLRGPNQRFAAILNARGFAYEFHILPGGHDWGQWNAAVPGCFAEMIAKLGMNQSPPSGRS